MYESGFQCLTRSDEEFLLDCYSEKAGHKDGISITEFKDIILAFPKFNKNQTYILDLLEKVKKKIKERQVGISENELVIHQAEFNEYLEFIAAENNRYNNERDPELKRLFDLFAGDEGITVNKSQLIDIISSFDLPIKVDDFFTPVGKKIELSFSDFCSLFKNNGNSSIGDELLKSFSSGFNPEQTVIENLFPVSVNKFKGYQ